MANLRHQTSILRSIQSDTADLNKNKIIFNGRMTDGTNEYLPNANYTSSPIYFYWENTTGKTIYIEQYFLVYPTTEDPEWLDLYHSPRWDSKIGLLNEAETDIEEPYITLKYNLDFMNSDTANNVRRTWTSGDVYSFKHNFTRSPMKIEPGRKFAQYIAGNLTVNTTTPLYGRIEGYYYD